MTAYLLAALLALYPGPQSQCIERRAAQIVADADAAAAPRHIPPAILLATAFLETHIGCDHGEGGGWGAPSDRNHRHRAGRAEQAASSLALGLARCHSWLPAVRHFRNGRCVGGRIIGYQPTYALLIAQRMERRAQHDHPSPAWGELCTCAGCARARAMFASASSSGDASASPAGDESEGASSEPGPDDTSTASTGDASARARSDGAPASLVDPANPSARATGDAGPL